MKAIPVLIYGQCLFGITIKKQNKNQIDSQQIIPDI